MTWLQHSHLLFLIRILLAVIFLSSSIVKIRNPRHFIVVVASYEILPPRLVYPFALFLPWVEFVIGLMFLWGWNTQLAASISAGLMTVFITAIAINIFRGRHELECGCFGVRHQEKIGWNVVARDAILLLVLIQVALSGGGLLALDNLPTATQQLILETYVIDILLPLALAVTGLWLLARLIRQLTRLVSLTPMEQR